MDQSIVDRQSSVSDGYGGGAGESARESHTALPGVKVRMYAERGMMVGITAR